MKKTRQRLMKRIVAACMAVAITLSGIPAGMLGMGNVEAAETYSEEYDGDGYTPAELNDLLDGAINAAISASNYNPVEKLAAKLYSKEAFRTQITLSGNDKTEVSDEKYNVTIKGTFGYTVEGTR